ncbi:MAG: hypothetical protein GY720_14310 [bacterium]|nr:hypothetical protein [bacterium]
MVDAVAMDTAAIDLVRESGQLQMLISPGLVGSTLGLVAVVLTGWPGRMFLAFQTRIAVNRDTGRTTRR